MHKRRRFGDSHGKPAVLESGENDEDDGDLVQAAMMDDTIAAVELLRSECPTSLSRPFPIILATQIYSIVKDRTEVDKSLANNKETVRMFMMVGSSTDILVQHMADYTKSLQDACKAAVALDVSGVSAGQSNRQPGKRSRDGEKESGRVKAVFGRFVSRVIPQYPGLYISKKDLLSSLALSDLNPQEDPSHIAPGSRAEQEALNLLTRGGALAARDAFTYWFTPVGSGPFLHEVGRGREELLKIISRHKFGEVLVRELRKRRLKGSSLGVKFHLRDLVGRGVVNLIETTSGQMVKLIKI